MGFFGKKKEKPGILTFLKSVVKDIGNFLEAVRTILERKYNISDKYEKAKDRGSFIYQVGKALFKGETEEKSIIAEAFKKVGKKVGEKASGKLGKIRDWYAKKAGFKDKSEEEPKKRSLFNKIGSLFKKEKNKPEEASEHKAEENNQAVETPDESKEDLKTKIEEQANPSQIPKSKHRRRRNRKKSRQAKQNSSVEIPNDTEEDIKAKIEEQANPVQTPKRRRNRKKPRQIKQNSPVETSNEAKEDIKAKIEEKHRASQETLNKTMAEEAEREEKRRQQVKEEKEADKVKKPEKDKKESFLSKILGGVMSVGKFIVGGITKGFIKYVIPGMLKGFGWIIPKLLGRLGGGVVGTVARGALSVGSWALGGIASGAGSLLAGAASTVAGALAPIALPALAVAGVAAAAYFAYKYITRDDASDVEQLRLYQYGVSKKDKQHNHVIYSMEEILKTLVIFDESRGAASVPKIPLKEYKALLELFGIKQPDEKEAANKDEKKQQEQMVNKEKKRIFDQWLYKRAIVVYANHVTAIKKVNKSYTVNKVNDLKDEDMYKYLSLLKNPASIYDVKENPLTGPDTGEITSDFVNKYLEKLINDFKSKIKATGKSVDEEHKKIQAELDKKKQEDAQAAEKRKQDALAKQQQQQNSNNPQATKTSYKADTPAVNPGEEGKPLASGQNSGPQTTTDNASKPLGGPLVTDNKTFDGIKLASQNVDIQDLNPALKERLGGLAAEYKQLTGESITINSAYRSPEEQKKLYEQNGGNSKLAAPPGTSLHEYGLAVDANSADLNKADKLGLLAKYGFTRPVGGETWHLEPTGVSAYPELAKRDPNKATELIESSLYKGGGGFALVGKKGSGRNTNMQLAIFNKDVDTSQLQKENPLSSPIEKTNQPPVTANQNKPQDTTVQAQTTKQSSQQPRSVVFKQSSVNVGEEGTKPSSSSTGIPVAQSNINTPPIKVMGNGNYSVQESIKLAAQLTGMDEGLLNRIAQIESSGRANAKASTSSATGLFQFTSATWQNMLKKYAGIYNIPPDAKPDNPLYSAILGAQYAKDNLAFLRSKVGDFPIPEDTAIYLAHHYGPNGAVNILKFLKQNPSTPMQSAVDGKVYAANQSELGQKSIGEYMDYLNKKLGVGSVTMFSKTTGTTANAPKAAAQVTPGTATASTPKVTAQATPSAATASAPNSASASVGSTGQASAQPALRPSISGPSPSPLYKQQNDITPATPKDAIVKIDTSTMEKLLQNQTTILEKIFTAVDSINQKYTPGGSKTQSQEPIINNSNNSNQKPSYGFKDVSSTSVNLGRMVNV